MDLSSGQLSGVTSLLCGSSYQTFNTSSGGAAGNLVLYVSEDTWQGDAQFTISVDGAQVGGTYTATASHRAGQTQTFTVAKSLAAGANTIGINFINDAYTDLWDVDRNLYLDKATIDGQTVGGASLTFLSGGSQSFSATGPAPALTSTSNSTSKGSTAVETLVLFRSEYSWQGDAQFNISVDAHR